MRNRVNILKKGYRTSRKTGKLKKKLNKRPEESLALAECTQIFIFTPSGKTCCILLIDSEASVSFSARVPTYPLRDSVSKKT